MSDNPLAKHFRTASIYIKLPSKGKYWKEEDIDIPQNGELPIYPMNSTDEINLRIPDALLNGNSTINLIKSCVPNIKNPWNIPITDMDAILIGIRMASYGSDMDMEITCPNTECNTVSDFSLDLRNALSSIKTSSYDKEVMIEGLKFKFKPHTYKQSNKSDQLEFEQKRMIKAISDSTIPDAQKNTMINESIQKVNYLVHESLADNVAYIETPDGQKVNNKEYIIEYFMSCSREVYNGVKNHLTALNTASKLKPMHVQCSKCNHKFDTEITFDYSRFFA